ncbi:DinB family protein [Niabella pedocola]|uniref:DinB family protein n=1 Tax=Niabella pedocola TaxID=1752077 RepID=A0ABS8PWR0_9BACT|nr:DinB family protein [Niabella pedocola]MCD2424712.1 DinB family protein [Niabella pedocola]
MTRLEILKKDFENEVLTTRKFLNIIPEDKWDWKPHPKSMSLMQLTIHIAELPGWPAMVFDTSELDFAAFPYQPTVVKDRKELLDIFEREVEKAGKYLNDPENEKKLDDNWTLREGDAIYGVNPKLDVVRMSINQTIHHRAQLGVFLRLLDIPIPGSYGPSADESF